MTETLCIKPLRCGHCGRELPVMGQLVTFQCPECSRYWVLSRDALEPITVFRAVPDDGTRIAASASDLRLSSLLGRRSRRGRPEEPDRGGREGAAERRAGRYPDRLRGGSARSSPPRARSRHLAARIESLGILKVYVPAFKSLNTYAYLKVGRLLTRIQPSFGLERSDGAGHPILCALRAEEAVALIDFIFFATLPESIQSNGDFLEKIHLSPARPPRLVEFPFRERGASLVSIIGGFWISGRLVAGSRISGRMSSHENESPASGARRSGPRSSLRCVPRGRSALGAGVAAGGSPRAAAPDSTSLDVRAFRLLNGAAANPVFDTVMPVRDRFRQMAHRRSSSSGARSSSSERRGDAGRRSCSSRSSPLPTSSRAAS